MYHDHPVFRVGARRLLLQAALLIGLPLAAHAQLSWSVFDETTTTPVASQSDGTTTVTVPAGKRVTLIATNFVPVDFTANPTGEVYATINFKASGGLSTIAGGTRAIGYGLYNNSNTATNTPTTMGTLPGSMAGTPAA